MTLLSTTRKSLMIVIAALSLGSLASTAAADPSKPQISADGSSDSPPRDPDVIWKRVGCNGCHGEHGFYREKIQGSIGKPVDQVARWIRSAPSIKPDTPMPDFKTKISLPESRALAAWVQARAAAQK